MMFLEDLFLIVGLTFLVSIITAKLLSMASGFTPDNTLLPSVAAVIYVDKHDKQSAIAYVESEKGIFKLSEESAKVNDRKEEEFMRIENIPNEEVISTEVEVGGVREISIEDGGVGVGGDELAEQVFDKNSEIPKFDGTEKQLFDEIPERLEFIEDEENVHNLDEDEECNLGNVSDEVNKNEEEEGWLDDWEGIERTELDKRFGAAVAFMGSEIYADRVLCIASDVKMELYGLQKVAIEGPCRERQPMALKVSARAKWNAWKQREDMSREEAMGQYVTLLSRTVQDWMGDSTFEVQTIEPYIAEHDVIGVEGPNFIDKGQ